MRWSDFGGVTAAARNFALPALLATVGCSTAPTAAESSLPEGPPKLEMFIVVWTDGQGQQVHQDLLSPPDGGVAPSSPMSTVRAVFDRLLKGGNIETVDPDGGPNVGVPGVATATWEGAAPIALSASYVPNGSLVTNPPGPAVVLSPVPSLPSGATVAITLDKDKITSKAGEPFVGAETFAVETAPLEAVIDCPQAPQVDTFKLKITFNNVIGDPAELGRFITVTADGVPLAVSVSRSARAPSTTLDVVRPDPADPRSALPWPAGAQLAVKVDGQYPDVFGVPLGHDVTCTFAIGATDGGMPDGGADAAVEGEIDAAGDAAESAGAAAEADAGAPDESSG